MVQGFKCLHSLACLAASGAQPSPDLAKAMARGDKLYLFKTHKSDLWPVRCAGRRRGAGLPLPLVLVCRLQSGRFRADGMIENTCNGWLWKMVWIKGNEDDTIGDLKKLRPHRPAPGQTSLTALPCPCPLLHSCAPTSSPAPAPARAPVPAPAPSPAHAPAPAPASAPAHARAHHRGHACAHANTIFTIHKYNLQVTAPRLPDEEAEHFRKEFHASLQQACPRITQSPPPRA